MADPNFIRIDIAGGWFDQLVREIDKNRDFSLLCANNSGTSDESRHNFKSMAERDERVKAKLMKYTDSSGCARLYSSEYQEIFWILLENACLRNDDKEEKIYG